MVKQGHSSSRTSSVKLNSSFPEYWSSGTIGRDQFRALYDDFELKKNVCMQIFQRLTLSGLNLPFKIHYNPLQSANCCRNSRLVVDKDDLKWIKMKEIAMCWQNSFMEILLLIYLVVGKLNLFLGM